jgi:hypothetical protein
VKYSAWSASAVNCSLPMVAVVSVVRTAVSPVRVSSKCMSVRPVAGSKVVANSAARPSGDAVRLRK